MTAAVPYLRVSTRKQDLSIEAQRSAVHRAIEREGFTLINGREYVEQALSHKLGWQGGTTGIRLA